MMASTDGEHLNSHHTATADLKHGTTTPNTHRSTIVTAAVSIAYLGLVNHYLTS